MRMTITNYAKPINSYLDDADFVRRDQELAELCGNLQRSVLGNC